MMMREKEEETAKGDKSVLIVFKWVIVKKILVN
jgi:hypothetical protein